MRRYPFLEERADRRAVLKGAAGATAALSLPATGLAAPGSTDAQFARRQGDPSTLVIATDGAPSDLDPHSAYDYRSVLAILGAYEGLIGLVGSSTDELEGLIAESWESNDDLSVWTFKIRPGLTFHDGSPLDAEAVRLNYERFLTLGLGPVGVLQRFVEDHSQITAPDASTVVFDLGRPQPLFPFAMASTYGPLIVNAKLMKEHEQDGDWGHFWAQTNAEGTGSGAYRITRVEPGQEVELERFDAYWRGWDGAHFDKVLIRAVTENETRRQLLEQGEADIVDSLTIESYDALSGNPDITIQTQYTTRSDYFAMAMAGPLESPEARRAMNYAFPFTEVIDGIFGGRARQPRGPIPQELRGYDPNAFQYTTDLDQARELLQAAGVEEGATLTMLMETGDERTKSAAQLYQANLAQIGIQLNIEETDTASYAGLLYSDVPPEERPNFMPWFWWPDYNDAWNHLYPQVSCDAQGSAGANIGFYCNDQVQELLDASKNAVDDESYFEAIGKLQQILSHDDPPSVYWVEPPWVVYQRADIEGISINPINTGTYNFWAMKRITSE